MGSAKNITGSPARLLPPVERWKQGEVTAGKSGNIKNIDLVSNEVSIV